MAGNLKVLAEDGEVTEYPTGTVYYSFKVPGELKFGQKGRYGGEEMGVYIPFDPRSENVDDVLVEAQKVVLDALGIERASNFDEDAGIERVTALLVESFPGAEVVAADEPRPAPAAAPAQGNGPIKVRVIKPLNSDHPDWLDSQWQALVDQGKVEATDNELWDNRKFLPQFGGKSKSTASWYKTSKGGVSIWPPRSSR